MWRNALSIDHRPRMRMCMSSIERVPLRRKSSPIAVALASQRVQKKHGYATDGEECFVCLLDRAESCIAPNAPDARVFLPLAEAALRSTARVCSVESAKAFACRVVLVVEHASWAIANHGADDRSRAVRSYVCSLRKYIDRMTAELHFAVEHLTRTNLVSSQEHVDLWATVHMSACASVNISVLTLIAFTARNGAGEFAAATLGKSMLDMLSMMIKWLFVVPGFSDVTGAHVEQSLTSLKLVMGLVEDMDLMAHITGPVRAFVDAHRLAMSLVDIKIRHAFKNVAKAVGKRQDDAPPRPLPLGPSVGCTNRRCMNVAGDSEDAMPMKQCKRCKRARYCSVMCQKEDWVTGHCRICQA